MTAFKQSTLSPHTIELAVYAGNNPTAALFESPHRKALIARIRETLAPAQGTGA